MTHPTKPKHTDAPPGKPARSAASNARRRFIQSTAGAAGAGCLMALGVGLYASQSRALPASAIRPPGALPEADFLSACVRCGLCVRACPFDTLELAELGDNVATGTPYFTARNIPCEMCDDIPCVAYCPTGALDRGLNDIDDARMGLAVLIDQENCLNFLGLRCDVCYRVCPLIDKAITLETQHNPRSDRHAMLLPTVHSDACTGCGKCEKSCVLPGESAIKVLPIRLAQGSAAQYYRRGWEEKSAAGGESLIGEQVELPVRGLEQATPNVMPQSAPKPAVSAPDISNIPVTRPPVVPRDKEPLFQPFSSPGIDSGWKP